MSLTVASCGSHDEIVVPASRHVWLANSVTRSRFAGFFAPPFISLGRRRGSWVMVMPIPQIHLPLSVAPRCAWLKPKLRDRLCVLIRQYNLDPTLVKAYAADFCGTPILKEASRELVESFISHLATCAKENRDGLLCKLNSYAQPVEVKL